MSCNSRNLYLSIPVSSNKLGELVSKNKLTRSFIFCYNLFNQYEVLNFVNIVSVCFDIATWECRTRTVYTSFEVIFVKFFKNILPTFTLVSVFL